MMIVPTGVGAAIGGYAGDALPVVRALASVVDCLISHPNVMWPHLFVCLDDSFGLNLRTLCVGFYILVDVAIDFVAEIQKSCDSQF